LQGAVPQGSLTFHADDPADSFTFSPEQAQDHFIGSFIDVFNPMLGPDGKPDPTLFSGDRLHMNEKGYALWTRIIREAMGLPPKTPGAESGS
jgi:hypothetical protein